MNQIERIPYNGTLPESFFLIPNKIYSNLDFIPEENSEEVKALFDLKRRDHEIILYTDHTDLRLVGMFPNAGTSAYFGYWETSDTNSLNKIAFDQLEIDAKNHGKISLVGPMHFNTFHRYRLRLGDTPSWKMFDREPVNPAYYPKLLESLQYEITLNYESRLIPSSQIKEIYKDKQEFVAKIKELPFKIIPLTPENWQQYEQEIFELIEAIFNRNAGYKAVDISEYRLLYNQQFAEKLCPHTASLFKDETSGKLVALTFCHPNYKPVIATPAGIPSFQLDYPKLKEPTMLAKSSGVHPDFRKMNLMNYSGAYAMLTFKELYKDTIFCLMKTDSYSRHFTDGIACEKACYALYEKNLKQ